MRISKLLWANLFVLINTNQAIFEEKYLDIESAVCQLESSECGIPKDKDCPIERVSTIEDPFDCHNFYLCNEGIASMTPYTCMLGSYYDVETCTCIEESEMICTDKCIIRYDCSPADCSDIGVMAYPDQFSCNDYFICDLQDRPLPASCLPPTLYFNGQQCTEDASQCCTTTQCQPYCGSGPDVVSSNVADPCDCHSYYLCEHEDSVPTIQGTCSEVHEVFDGSGCSDTISCRTTCSVAQCTKATTTTETTLTSSWITEHSNASPGVVDFSTVGS